MAWQLKGTCFEACSCAVACPCVMVSAPTEGERRALIAWHVDESKDGAVDLGGLNVALAVHSPGHRLQTKRSAALDLDERASAAPQDALARILAGQAGGHAVVLASFVDRVLGVASEPAGRRRSLAIPGIAAAAIEALEGQGGGAVTISGHPWCVAPGEPAVVARSQRLDDTDHRQSWQVSERNGFYSPFAYQGG